MKDSKLIGGVAIIENDGKHLLIKQSRNKPFSGQWRHPGGKFELGENVANGMKREVKEEVGLEIELVNENPVMVIESDYEPGSFGFFTARFVGGQLRIDKKEIEDVGWFTIEEIKKMDLMNATRRFYERET